MQGKLKFLLAVFSAALITASYGVCYTWSGNNCVWVGKTDTWSFDCDGTWVTTTRTATQEVTPTDYAVVVETGGTHWTRRWTENNCFGEWKYIDCHAVEQRITASTGYYQIWTNDCSQ